MENPDIFDLDISQLDRHWLEQPQLVYKYGAELADAKDKLERAKAALDVAKAEAKAKINANPERYGLSKTTDSVVNSAVEIHKRVIKKRDKLF